MPLPLADLRVIDLTVARAGPTCVRQLADWGADVIRIEPPVPVPPSHGGPQAAPGQGSADSAPQQPAGIPLSMAHRGSDYQNLHRNKRALSLDLKSPRGREILLSLIDGADVLVENMRPPVKHRLGFDYASVHARNPRLVYGSISGFGQTGPYAERGGVDQIAQGMGGLMSVTGIPPSPPTRVGIPISDLSSGLYLAIGILSALHARERTGVGQYVETSLLESMLSMLDLQAARWTIDHEIPTQEGNHHPTLVPMGCFESADGYVNIAGPTGRLLKRFCDAIGLPELPTDPRFDSAGKRSANRRELNEIIAARLRSRPTQEWVTRLNEAGIPCGPVYRIDEAFADPQVEHLQMTAPVEHPELGHLALLRNAVRMSDAPSSVREPSPMPGQHTDEILGELGLAPDEVAALRRQGII